MAQKDRADEQGDSSSGEFVGQYQRLMDEVMPYLPVAEQILYHRLFRLSHGRRSPYVQCRYEELAHYCGLSLRTMQRALKGLKHKQVVKTVWQSHGATTFTVRLPWELPRKPVFLPRQSRMLAPSPARFALTTPPVYDAFTPEDRELFLTCKRSLNPERLNTFTEEAVEWLSEQANGDPNAFSDELLRDKVDELIFHEVFGPERQKTYGGLFSHLHLETSPYAELCTGVRVRKVAKAERSALRESLDFNAK
jgi:hypothetical protein